MISSSEPDADASAPAAAVSRSEDDATLLKSRLAELQEEKERADALIEDLKQVGMLDTNAAAAGMGPVA